MTAKAIHSIENCQDCREIFLLIAKSGSIRFNKIKKNSQFSAPRLSRHLKGMEKLHLIKRTEISNQEVVYSLVVSIKDLNLVKYATTQKIEQLQKIPLQKLIDIYIEQTGIFLLEELIVDMNIHLKQYTSQERIFRRTLAQSILGKTLALYRSAMGNRDKSEYIEILKKLKNEQSDLIKEFESINDLLKS